MRQLLALVCAVVGCASAACAADAPKLTLTFDAQKQSFTAAELLARSDVETIHIPNDPSYGVAMEYQVVPLLTLLGDHPDANLDTIEAAALDGFVSQIPLALVTDGSSAGGSAWIAVEDPAHPWPPLPNKTVSAGPFYLVWEQPEGAGVGSEQWPYQLATLTGVKSPAHRWPQMVVRADVPADAPARHGQAVFTAQCMPCHRMKGAGVAELGPDLGQPMGPTQYFQTEALRKLIRDPKSVRTWPQQVMPGFTPERLTDTDLEAVIAYLGAMAPAAH